MILRLILGDQLNYLHSWLAPTNSKVLYCMFEMKQETEYAVHHIQKVVGFFKAMRSFAAYLEKQGHTVIYYTLSNSENKQTLEANLNQLIQKHSITKFEYQLPDEYRLDKQLNRFVESIDIPSEKYDTEHFYTDRNELRNFFHDKKLSVMESFYQNMRKKHSILMDKEQPVGGKWNYDKSNRKKWTYQTLAPNTLFFKHDVTELLKEIQNEDIVTIGKINPKYFDYPINRDEALQQLNYFIDNLLEHFGDYQDAMHTENTYLFHSRISFALNTKMIHPKEVVNKVEKAYRSNSGIEISQAEGFIRQIVGWREFMRGMYWKNMPEFKNENFFHHKNQLAEFFWTGKTKMNCVKVCVQNSLENGYAHHIQRLMVLGNLMLLLKTDPKEVDQWFLGIYIDAIEWVQLTNTRGMSQYADGGNIATKPYVSSANYIQKMSNYCESCFYDKKTKTENNSCPFNSLYWNFLLDTKNLLQNNQRMSMMFMLLSKIKEEEVAKIKQRAEKIIKNPEDY